MPRLRVCLALLALILSVTACTSTPTLEPDPQTGTPVCDSYLILDMCVQDVLGDGAADMVYFTDTLEIFMYRNGMKNTVMEIMPLHQCAVPLNAGMQATTNRILLRAQLSFAEELEITRQLIANYLAAKPEIDAFNSRFQDEQGQQPPEEDDFFMEEPDWDDE